MALVHDVTSLELCTVLPSPTPLYLCPVPRTASVAPRALCSASASTSTLPSALPTCPTATRDTLIESITAAGPGEPGTVYRLHCHPKALEKMLQVGDSLVCGV